MPIGKAIHNLHLNDTFIMEGTICEFPDSTYDELLSMGAISAVAVEVPEVVADSPVPERAARQTSKVR